MSANLLVYTASCDNEFKQDSSSLQSRWKTEKVWREFRQNLLNAINSNDASKVSAVLSRKNFLMNARSNLVYEKTFPLVDLRGIELKSIQLQDFDFSYCCFDFASLINVSFNKTGLQYSSFNNAVIKKSQFVDVQASPISVTNAKFEDIVFEKGFFMHSDFRGSSFIRCNVPLNEFPSAEFSAF